MLAPELGVNPTIPIGFISFDLDYYSSTMEAFEILRESKTLPRVWSYFDDVNEISSRHGELLAIDEWNSKCKEIHISMVQWKHPVWVDWGHHMRVIHYFEHSKYAFPLHSGIQHIPL